MLRYLKGCLVKGLVALAFVAMAYAGFRWGDVVFPRLERALRLGNEAEVAEGPSPSAELAEATLDRFERFRAGGAGDRLALGGLELSSVVRFALPGIVPPGVTNPLILMHDGRIELSASVATEAFPRLPNLDQILGLLPDTMLVEVRGTLVPFDQKHLALMVDRVRAAKIPIPQRLVAGVLDGLGRQVRADLVGDALTVPLPDGLETAFVLGDSLVLVAER